MKVSIYSLNYLTNEQKETIPALVEKALAGKSWSDFDVDGLDTYDAVQLAASTEFETLPKWAKAVVEWVLIEHYSEPETAAMLLASLPTEMPPSVVALARIICRESEPPASAPPAPVAVAPTPRNKKRSAAKRPIRPAAKNKSRLKKTDTVKSRKTGKKR